MDHGKWVSENLYVLLVSGSRLYGTARPDSDYDYRGVCAMPAHALLGHQGFEQYQGPVPGYESDDSEVYGLSKFFSLALANNPNILDILFARPRYWLVGSPEFNRVWQQRYDFLSEKVRHTFSGYAVSQLKRLQGHRVWLTMDEPPPHPEPGDFRGWLVQDKHGGQKLGFETPEDRQKYNDAKLLWDNYERWLRERNPARADTERRVGYDTKNAAHLVRLLLKCVTILKVGDYDPTLEGSDLALVQQVLAGTWSYETLIDFVNEHQAQIDTVTTTTLPYAPNFTAVETLLIELNYAAMRKQLG